MFHKYKPSAWIRLCLLLKGLVLKGLVLNGLVLKALLMVHVVSRAIEAGWADQPNYILCLTLGRNLHHMLITQAGFCNLLAAHAFSLVQRFICRQQ